MSQLRRTVGPRGLAALVSMVAAGCSFTVSLDELQGGVGSAGGGASGGAATGGGGAGGGAGGLDCPSGSTDCDGDGASCEDLASDSVNCGTCGHDCLGGDCVGGMCQPVVLWAGRQLDGRATGIDQTVDNLFATTTLGVVRVPKAGGAPQFLTTETSGPRIRVDGPYAFFTHGILSRVPLAGGADEPLAQKAGWSGRGVSVDATHAYAVRYMQADVTQVELVRVPRDGGAEEILALNGTDAWGVDLDDTDAYVTGPTGVYRIPKTTPLASTAIWDGDAGGSMAILDGQGYVLGAGLWRVDLATGQAALLDGELSSGQIATDGQRLYYTLFLTGEVGRIELEGTGRVALANVEGGVDVLVVDQQAIYFTLHFAQSIVRLAK